MVCYDLCKISALPGFTLLHIVIHLLLQACNVCIELFIRHAMPSLARVWACTLANWNVVVKLEDTIVGIGVCGLSLILTWIHRVGLDTWNFIVSIVVRLMENAGAWSKFKLFTSLHRALP